MPLLDNDPFLSELSKLFAKTKGKGSVWLTLKRSTAVARTAKKGGATGRKAKGGAAAGGGKAKAGGVAGTPPAASSPSGASSMAAAAATTTTTTTTTVEETEPRCLLRATDGKTKLSTLVRGRDLNRFLLAYATLLKANMDSLKKKERKRRPKTDTA